MTCLCNNCHTYASYILDCDRSMLDYDIMTMLVYDIMTILVYDRSMFVYDILTMLVYDIIMTILVYVWCMGICKNIKQF